MQQLKVWFLNPDSPLLTTPAAATQDDRHWLN